MIRSRALFVVGAGASKEAELPTGDELKRIIAAKLDISWNSGSVVAPDDALRAALLFHVEVAGRQGGQDSFSDYIETARRMSAAMPLSISIDNYMEAHRSDPKVQVCGKLAIVRSIMEAERDSKLATGAPTRAIDFTSLEPTWFARFFKMLAEACETSNIETLFENVTMVNFNYDRCVEHFLVQAIRAYFGVDEARAEACVARMTRYHPYGTVAPWREGSEHVPYGTVVDSQDHLLALAKRIRTYSEETAEGTDIAAMKAAIGNAEVIVFLGFAFHPLNMALLQPANRASPVARVYATAHEMSGSDVEVITQQILTLAHPYGPSIKVSSGKCADLFQEYARVLAQR